MIASRRIWYWVYIWREQKEKKGNTKILLNFLIVNGWLMGTHANGAHLKKPLKLKHHQPFSFEEVTGTNVWVWIVVQTRMGSTECKQFCPFTLGLIRACPNQLVCAHHKNACTIPNKLLIIKLLFPSVHAQTMLFAPIKST